MNKILAEPRAVFEKLEEICAIPHGSGDMQKISDFCVAFAKKNGLRYIQDEALNVVIYKEGTCHLKNAAPIILQGHLDMVCQKEEGSAVNFAKDGILPFIEGDFVRAKGTTLGADNGIAVAMIMAILEREDIAHPPIEAVFTTDEEIGMVGAGRLDMSVLSSKRMINLDAEEDDTLTVSCAGGCDVHLCLPISREKKEGTRVTLRVRGLLGGHSGVEIDKGRVNANVLLGRLLTHARKEEADILSVNGGSKGNAIPGSGTASLLVRDWEAFSGFMKPYIEVVQNEIRDRETEVCITLEKEDEGSFLIMEKSGTDKFIHLLLAVPDGVIDWSRTIPGLVETSLNLGILETKEDGVHFHYALRSNKRTALSALKEKIAAIAGYVSVSYNTGGEYSPWEYRENSALRTLYAETYREMQGEALRIAAIHAGLECAVFAAAIDGLDCIAIGPTMTGVHTPDEALRISSVQKVYALLCETLKKCE